MEGGQFFRGDVVEIERIDVYDFKTVISEKEFHQLALLADKLSVTIEQAFAEIVGMGFTDSNDIVKRKE